MQTIVDVSKLRHNVRRVRARTGNGFCAVVKSNAYGHGIAIACYIEPIVDCFMVATAGEAMELLAVTRKPILTLGGDIVPYLKMREPQIIPTVCDVAQLDGVIKAGYRRFSVALNTGMNRLGADEYRLEFIKSRCKELGIAPWSVYSHLYGGASSAPEQSKEFERLTADGIFRKKRHLYCSCALEVQNADLYDMTRCGIAMYGYADGMEICMKVRAKILAMNYVSRGEHIGYDNFVLDKDTVVATVRCGYADGIRRCGKQLYLRVRGIKCPIIGVPCMDLCMIDVTGVPCRVGEYAYLISEKEDAEYLAECYGTIVYEVLTGFNGRNERVYV